MSYKVIVVDDEITIRNGITKFINRFSDDFDVVDSFSDGKEVIEYLARKSVDLIISDIKMSDMDGIELSSFVHNNYPDTKMIILSGYADFEYANKLMKNDVSIYLLKPLENAQLLDSLKAIKKQLDEKKKIREKLTMHNALLTEVKRIFFVDLIFGKTMDLQSPMHKMALSDFDEPDKKHCSIIKIQWSDNFSDYLKCSENSPYSLISSFFTLDNPDCFCTHLDNNKFLLIQNTDNITKALHSLVSWGKETYHADIETKIEFECVGIFSLKNYSEHCGIGISSNLKNDVINSQRLKLFISYICFNMREEAYGMFSLFVENEHIAPAELFELLCSKIDIDIKMDSSKYIRLINNNMSYSNVFSFFMDDYLNATKDSNILITKIKDYICKNYMHNISLEVLSNVVYMHPAYLSHFFKQETGINFSEYLFDIRMINATRLLGKNKYKINEISKMVGYSNYRYFLKQFKEYTSYTPNDYRKILWIDAPTLNE